MSNSKANQCQIVLGTSSMETTREPIANNVTELIPKLSIVRVWGEKYNTRAQMAVTERVYWDYRFPTMTIIGLELTDGNTQFIELQEVTNQNTWNLGTLASLQAAVADINAWL